jgi:hypothetical protein
MMTKQADASWLDLLSPDVLRKRLISCSLYIAAFHILKASIIDRIKDFYLVAVDESGRVFSPDYVKEVLSRNTSPVHASLDWLKSNGVVEDTDIVIYSRLADRRNILSHRLDQVILKNEFLEDLPTLFSELQDLLKKIEVWWIVNLDIPITSELPPIEIDENAIIPGTLIALQLMTTVAFGSDDEAKAYLNAYLIAKAAQASRAT